MKFKILAFDDDADIGRNEKRMTMWNFGFISAFTFLCSLYLFSLWIVSMRTQKLKLKKMYSGLKNIRLHDFKDQIRKIQFD